jgi:hypothetical protein
MAMKKSIEELDVQEKDAFDAEILRMFKLGAAMQVTAAKSAGEESKGWPHIAFTCEGRELEVSFCYVIDQMLEYNKRKTIEGLGVLALMLSSEDLSNTIVHDTMHDIFCLGLAATVMLEMDISNLTEELDTLDDYIKGNLDDEV